MADTYFMDPVDFDDIYTPDCQELDDLFSKTILTTVDIDVDVIFEEVHAKRLPRGSLTAEQLRERRRERRQMPTAKAKETDRRVTREVNKDKRRHGWLEREGIHRAFVQLCLTYATSVEDQALCAELIVESNAALERARTLCPNTMREELNAVQQRWEGGDEVSW